MNFLSSNIIINVVLSTYNFYIVVYSALDDEKSKKNSI